MAAVGQIQAKATPVIASLADDRPASVPAQTQAPIRPAAPRSAVTASSILKQPQEQSAGGFLDEDEDDLDGWGAMDDDAAGDSFFDGLEKKVGRQVQTSRGASSSPAPPPAASSTGGVSSFGPKPFLVRNEDDDFEAMLAGAKKKTVLPKGLAKKTTPPAAARKPVVPTAPVRKTVVPAKKAEVKKADAWGDGDDGDWGDGWN